MAISHNGSLLTEPLSKIPTRFGSFFHLSVSSEPSSLPICFSPLSSSHPPQTSLNFHLFCLLVVILLSDGLELVVAHELSIACSGFDARRLHSLHRNLPLLGRYLQIWYFGFWQFFSTTSIGLAHWSAHQSGPIRHSLMLWSPFPFSFPTPPTFAYVAASLVLVFSLPSPFENTTPQMTRFRGAKVCGKWLQERIDDHSIQSDYKCTIGLKVQK